MSNEQYRIFAVFFGISRSLPHTIEGIRSNALDFSYNGNFNFTTIASLNLVNDLINPRTGERQIGVDHANIFLLDADHYILSRQSDDSIDMYLHAAQQQRDPFGDEWKSVRNYIHQQTSLRRAWNFIIKNYKIDEKDYFLFLRPDLLYLNNLPVIKMIQSFRSMPDRAQIAVPVWHSYGGFNDRFAFANALSARIYANRIDFIETFCLQHPLHAETFLKDVLLRHNVVVWDLPAQAQRVRAGGNMIPEDFTTSVIALRPLIEQVNDS